MIVKIENKSGIKLNNKKLNDHMSSILDSIPQAHLRGISKIVLVDRIEESRLGLGQQADLPGLYHPKMPGSPPWLEIALVPLHEDRSLVKRLEKRLTFKASVSATLLSLIAQHYYLTLSHGIKKSQFELAVRTYVEKQYRAYSDSKGGIRATLLRPLRPYLERFARWLQHRSENVRKSHEKPNVKQSTPAKRRRR
jgi:hypothetical protein